MGRETTLALTGDVMLGRGVNETLHSVRPEEPWGDALPLLLSADLRIINLECAITEYQQPWSRTPKVFHFRADPPAVEVLRAARVDACSLANNHTLDFEEHGLLDTLAYLEAAGILTSGAGPDGEQAARPVLLEDEVALVAFTDNEPSFAAGLDKPGTNYLPVSTEPRVLRRVEEAVREAREAGAETIVFSNHWGPNMVLRPPEAFRRFARAVVDLGADVYYGHSAHVF
jgi:poly-gamma-glutamate capsule biosynthesis protein CapA/YwtB (metallophosphatase superfamily)